MRKNILKQRKNVQTATPAHITAYIAVSFGKRLRYCKMHAEF